MTGKPRSYVRHAIDRGLSETVLLKTNVISLTIHICLAPDRIDSA